MFVLTYPGSVPWFEVHVKWSQLQKITKSSRGSPGATLLVSQQHPAGEEASVHTDLKPHYKWTALPVLRRAPIEPPEHVGFRPDGHIAPLLVGDLLEGGWNEGEESSQEKQQARSSRHFFLRYFSDFV